MLVGIAVAQVYIPTGVSTQSGIVRNIPTQIVRVPADTYISDGRQTYLAAQVPLQILNHGTHNNNNNHNNNQNSFHHQNNRQQNQFQSFNVREENLRRLIESEARLRDLLLFADQDNNNNDNNNNFNTNYNNHNNNSNNRFTTTDTFGSFQDQSTDNTNDNTNSNRNTQFNRGQLRALVSTTNRDTTDRQFRTNTDRLRDTSLLGRV